MTAQIAFRSHQAKKIFSSAATGVAKGDTLLEERRHFAWSPLAIFQVGRTFA